MKKIYLLISVVIIVIIAMVLLILFLPNKKGSSPNSFPLPSPVAIQKPGGEIPGGAAVIPTDATASKQASKIGELINELPYPGKNFALYYDFKNLQFMVYINPNNKVLGNSEFDKFLKDNGFSDRSLLEAQGLFTTYVIPSPTPAP